MAGSHSASLRPGHKPIKDWTRNAEEEAAYQRMLAKCAKWSEPPKEVMTDAQSSATTVDAGAASAENTLPILGPQLKWRKISEALIRSTCGRFEITEEITGYYQRACGYVVNSGTLKYQPWTLVPQLWYIRLGPLVADGKAAREVCEAHLRESA